MSAADFLLSTLAISVSVSPSDFRIASGDYVTSLIT
jgi:hypothetical protein